MLSQSDNEMLCGVGPGTAMGDVMRQYWIPAFLSKELLNNAIKVAGRRSDCL